jgi:hypothetical protein
MAVNRKFMLVILKLIMVLLKIQKWTAMQRLDFEIEKIDIQEF